MSPITIIMLSFSMLGAVDLIIGNKLGLGKEFERGIHLLGVMVMSMVGMIVFAPLIAHLLRPVIEWVCSVLPIEPSVIPSMILANDMGGAPLAMEFATNEEVGYFNGLIVSAMMGVTISFTLPFAMGVVHKEKHDSLLLGLLCGIVTTPIGALVSGLICALPIKDLLASVIPLLLFAGLIATALFLAPNACLKVFKVFGAIIKIIILVGLAVGIFEALTGWDIIPYTAPIQEGFDICTGAAMVLSGAFPLVYVLKKLLDKPMRKAGEKIGINATAAIGLLSILATSATAFGNRKDMDEKGAMLNSAFSVSAAYVLGSHLAFTMSFNSSYVLSMMIGKLVAGIASIFVAMLLYKMLHTNKETVTTSVEEPLEV